MEYSKAIRGLRGGFMHRFKYGDKQTRIMGRCVKNNSLWSIVVLNSELECWDQQPNQKMQIAFPSLNPDGREFLISGISPVGWEEIYSTEKSRSI
jgi:hypothetical protein